MNKKLALRVTALCMAMSMALSCAFGCIPASQAAELEPEAADVVMQEEAVDAAAETPEESEPEAEAEVEEEEEERSEPETEAAEAEVEEEAEEEPVIEAQSEEAASTGLIDFTSPSEGITIDAAKGTVTIANTGGDHFAVYDGLENRANSFIWEADVDFDQSETLHSAALIFGIQKKNSPGAHWSGANVDSGRGGDDAFRMFGPEVGGEVNCGPKSRVDFAQTIHFKLDIDEKGNFTYTYGNVGGTMYDTTGTLASWKGGYVGLLTWNSAATFSNVNFVDRSVEMPDVTDSLENDDRFTTSLTGLSTQNGTWEITDDGLHSNAIGLGDAFLYSETSAENYVYSTDVTFLTNDGAASLLFNNVSSSNHNECYAVNLEAGSKMAKFWRWTDGDAEHLINDKKAPTSENGVYNLKVVVIGGWVSYYVNDTLLASSGDYTLQPDDRGQDTCLKGGYLGLLNWNGDMVFQNTLVTPIEGAFDPTVKNITVSSSTGTVEKKAQFSSGEPIFIQYVENDASTVNINVTPVSSEAKITVAANGKTYEGGKSVPVKVGVNYIDVISTVTAEDGTTASLTYRVNVHRRQPASVYYNEPYRDQYHYSVKDGWANDPNGLVYYKGTYHFFYQFYDAKRWGPMHWAHATSKDLVHWEEQPIAFYPDANGAMFSGCIVADETNASGLFSSKEGGLIAFITADGNGQRIKLAYSEDEGVTWQKIDKIAADWSRDPLGSRDFRDPKVFRWEGKWFMVLAGGPLRIYSSENLVDWKCESTYSNLHTECPDLYPIKADDGAIKWVLSRGGRFYKIGDLKEVGGKWRFVPDAEYQNKDGVMNFGKDSYAAMTFYVQDFGTAQNPTLPDILEINWMNTWDNYCNDVADKVGQEFNGTFNLVLKEGVIKSGDTYLLTQTPIKGYDALRGEAVVNVKGAEVTADNTILENFAGDCYEIESTFYPAEGTTKVGFQLRVGEGEHTDVIYDLTTETICIDRSKSGIQISSRFTDLDSQSSVKRNADGSVTLHIYMDKASVEVFTLNDTVAGANQIFPSVDSLGAKVIVEGASATADIAIYPMSTVWEKVTTDVPAAITSSSAAETVLYVGDSATMKATLLPINVAQDIVWSAADESMVTLNAKGSSATITALKKGETTVTAAAAADSSISKTFTVRILENNFETNVAPFAAGAGNWFVDDKTLHDDDYCNNSSYISANPVTPEEYTLETKVAYTRGLINIFFAANSTNPFDEKHPYSIQIGDSQNIRLFFFAGDDIKTVSMGKHINDGQYHDVKITKTRSSVAVAIDGVEYLTHTFDSVGDYYNTNAHVGIGLWDGSVDVQTFYVNALNAEPEQPDEPVVPDEPAVKPSKPAVSAANSAKGVALKWTAQNAETYEVYRKSGSGAYKLVKTTADTEWTDTGVKNGVKYQYKVVAVNGTEKSASSAVKTIVYLKAVSLCYVKSGPFKTLKMRWSKNGTVNGYQIQYSTSKDFQSAKTLTVKSAKIVYKRTKSLKKKTKYYVRIRGYKTVSGKKYYSAWSGVKSAKTK